MNKFPELKSTENVFLSDKLRMNIENLWWIWKLKFEFKNSCLKIRLLNRFVEVFLMIRDELRS